MRGHWDHELWAEGGLSPLRLDNRGAQPLVQVSFVWEYRVHRPKGFEPLVSVPPGHFARPATPQED